MTQPAAHHPYTRAIARSLRRRCDVNTGNHLLVAVSGGPDSVALLRALAALAPRRRWRLDLTVGHIDHNLRPDSDADARFVAELADQLNLPVQARTLDGSRLKAAENLEAAARTARYRALADIALECGANLIATGHHADDQLETVLMRLLRGTSARGLRGLPWRRSLDTADHVDLIRPALAVDRSTAENLLATLDQPFRRDPTNEDLQRTRARLRETVLDPLRACERDVAHRAVRLTDRMRELHAALAWATDRVATELPKNGAIPREVARDLPPMLLTELLRRRLGDHGVPGDRLSNVVLEPIVCAGQDSKGGRRRFDLAGGVTVTVSPDAVTIGGGEDHSSADDSSDDP
ncbi:MAG: tRNA lysidine(34) synthetase TilS [Phycisphaeraceae bacterium]|nr:tRNA lysidine(34) synthetase TilS [Phycisphaeraceae bacterium]